MTDRPAFAAYLKAMSEHRFKCAQVSEWEREFRLGIRNDYPNALSAHHYAQTQREKGFVEADTALRDAFDAAVVESIAHNRGAVDSTIGR